jgi:hypothetical protein
MLHVHKFRMPIMCVKRKMDWHAYKQKNLILMLYFVHKNMIFITAMQLGSLDQFMTYTDTNYATLCRYLCSVVHHVKNMFHAQCAQI